MKYCRTVSAADTATHHAPMPNTFLCPFAAASAIRCHIRVIHLAHSRTAFHCTGLSEPFIGQVIQIADPNSAPSTSKHTLTRRQPIHGAPPPSLAQSYLGQCRE